MTQADIVDRVVAEEPRSAVDPASVTAVAVGGIFLLMLIGFLYVARSLIAPVLAAVFFSIMFSPVVKWLERWGLPPAVTAALCVGFVVALLNAAIYLLGDALSQWASNASEIAASFKAKAYLLERPFAAWRDLQQSIASLFGTTSDPVKLEFPLDTIVGRAVEFLTPAIGELIIFFGCLYFFLIARRGQRRFLVGWFEGEDHKLAVLRTINQIDQRMSGYFFAVTAVNVGVGVITAGLAYLFSLPGPALLGVAAFVLNYIPYIGPAATALVLFVVGVLSLPDLQSAVFAPLLFVGIATLEGHFFTPSLIGRQTTLSPLAMFLSLAFWTWLWGPIGTFLAMPLLIAIGTIYRNAVPDRSVALPG